MVDSATLDRHMRAAAIFGLGCSPKNLKPFQADETIDWRVGVPSATDQVEINLLFGGDGTIHRQLRQLVKLKLPVLIVPVGVRRRDEDCSSRANRRWPSRRVSDRRY